MSSKEPVVFYSTHGAKVPVFGLSYERRGADDDMWFAYRVDPVPALEAEAARLAAAQAEAQAEAKGLREALRWIAAQSCRRDAPCFELAACVTEKCETCYARAALAREAT